MAVLYNAIRIDALMNGHDIWHWRKQNIFHYSDCLDVVVW